MKSCIRCLLLVFLSIVWMEGFAQARSRAKHGYRGPTPTHPVIIWSRTIASPDEELEKRRSAAFKLSKYSQPIFQPAIVTTLIACAKDPDLQIKVHCTMALGNAKSGGQQDQIREVLIAQYNADPALKNTIVRTLEARKDDSLGVQKVLMDSLLKTENTDETLALLSYFEEFEPKIDDLADRLVDLYSKRTPIKVRRSIVKVLGTQGKGQDKVIDLLAGCAQEKDTPLALNCLAGLQAQAEKDARVWTAIQKTVLSDDPDVLLATLDLVNALPENKNPIVSHRLLEIVDEVEDPEIQEKAVLALGVCGDQTEETVNTLQKVFKNAKNEEATRVAAALTLGKQAAAFPDTPRELLSVCIKEGASQSLKTACKLGLDELKTAPVVAAPVVPAPATEAPVASSTPSYPIDTPSIPPAPQTHRPSSDSSQ